MNGLVSVQVQVQEGKIVKVEVGENHESADTGETAIRLIPARIVAEQTPYVDAISSATVTSQAIVYAVAQALGLEK